MKKFILLLFPLLFLVSAHANGGGGFEKRKYRDGAFKESVKKIVVGSVKKIHNGTKWIFNNAKGIGGEKASGAYYSGDFLGACILIGIGLSLIVFTIYVATATNPISWGLMFLYCLAAVLGSGCCFCCHH